MPAPMPIVGTCSDSVTRFASAAGIASISTIDAPAASSAFASATSRPAASSSLPCTRNPPSVCTDCGVRPMCAHTGMPRSTRNAVVGAMNAPPSSFTMFAPADMRRAALWNAASLDCWKLPNGMSPMTSARLAPRATQRTWYSISSIDTGSVESWPWITMPSESPISRMSTPAASQRPAKLAS